MERIRLAVGAFVSRCLGRGIGLGLSGAGFDVVVNYNRSSQAAEEVAAKVRELGRKALAIQADVSVRADRERFVDAVLEQFGHIDVLVNNAGVAPEVRADILEATEESFDRVIAINLRGPYFLTQRVAKHMIEYVQKHPDAQPKIINIGSNSAYTSSTSRGDYCISKAGIGMMTKLYADRLAEYGILVYEIRPGIIATDMTAVVKEKYDRLFAEGITPIRRWGTPEDVAKAVVALAEGALPYSTGEVINVDGGFHLHRL